MLSNYIRHKIGSELANRSNKVSYVQFRDNHKNSKGERAPWVILSHKNNKVLSSHKTKEEAVSHLQDMHVHASFMPRYKEIEIIVWLRQQAGLDKQQLTDFACEKFNISAYDAERFVLEALPDILDNSESALLSTIDEICPYNNTTKQLVNDVFSIQLDNAPFHLLEAYEDKLDIDTPSTINTVCYYLMRKRNLI